MKVFKTSLLIAGISSILISIFQVVVLFSVEWCRYFGAPEQFLSEPIILYVGGIIAAIIFTIFGLYGISGVGYIRRFPFLRLGLLLIGSIYTIRGLPFILLILRQRAGFTRGTVFPLVSLCIGLLYLVGTLGLWPNLKHKN